MAYTLADYARLAGDDKLKVGVVDILRANSVLMDSLTFDDAGRLNIEIIRTKSLPTVGTRKIGGTWTHTQGGVDSISERIVNLGNKIEIDKLLVKAQSIVDQRALQTQMFTKAMALKFNNVLINGNPSTDYDDLTGIRYRLINDLAAGQTILGGGLEIKAGATGLAANQLTFIDRLHELIDVTADGRSDFLIMNRETKLRAGAALRASGMLATTSDNYGRKFETFGAGGPVMLDIGPTDPLDRTARIITITELDDGSATTGGDASTIYSVKLGEEYLNGFQEYALDVQDMGLLEDGVTYRTVIDWPLGIYHVSPFAMARLVGIVAA
jgi:hypothetical protein